MFKGVYYIVQITFYKGSSNFQFHLPQGTIETAHFSKHSWISNGVNGWWLHRLLEPEPEPGSLALNSGFPTVWVEWVTGLYSSLLSSPYFSSPLLTSPLFFHPISSPLPLPFLPLSSPLLFVLTSSYCVVQVGLRMGAILCSSLPMACIRGLSLHAQVTYFSKIWLLHMCNRIQDTFSTEVLEWICKKMDPWGLMHIPFEHAWGPGDFGTQWEFAF